MENKRKKLHLPSCYLSRLVIAPVLLIILLVNVVIIVGYFMEAPFFVELATSWSAVLVGFMELLTIGVVIVYMVVNTHHIAGPMHSLEKALGSVGEGDLGIELKFRKNDYHQYIPEAFNENISRLRDRIAELQGIAESLAKAAVEDQEAREKIVRLHEGLRAIKTAASDDASAAKE